MGFHIDAGEYRRGRDKITPSGHKSRKALVMTPSFWKLQKYKTLPPPQEITRHFSNPIFNSQSKKPVPLDYEDTTPDLENPLSIWINSYIFSGPWHASRLDPQNETYSGINFSLITMLVLFNRTYLSPPWHVCSWSKQLNSAHIFLTKWRPPFK